MLEIRCELVLHLTIRMFSRKSYIFWLLFKKLVALAALGLVTDQDVHVALRGGSPFSVRKSILVHAGLCPS